MPRPRSLTTAQIADAALTVIDRDGLDELTIRAVSEQLGIATMSLYRYVDGREQVEELVLERVLDTLDYAPPADGPWRARALVLLTRLHETIMAHPRAIPLVLARRHTAQTAVAWGEALLGVLAGEGFAGEDLIITFRALLSYVVGAIQVEHYGPLSGAGTAALAALDPDAFPFITHAAGRARDLTVAEEFRRGAVAFLDALPPSAS
jgi:AcrR family transcriptional regulator